MFNIISLASHFFYTHQEFVLAATIAIPIAVESFLLIKDLTTKKDETKKRFKKYWLDFKDNFTQRQNETKSIARRRIFENALITTIVLSILGFLAYLPFTVMPLSFAIPVAIIGICSFGYLLKFISKIKNKKLSHIFSKKINESEEDAKKRIKKNIMITVLAVAALIIAAICLKSIISQYHMYKTGGNWPALIANPHIINLEYFGMGLLHLIKTLHNKHKKKNFDAFFSLISAIACFAFPLLRYFTPHSNNRLHHDMIGFFLQLLPFRSLQFLGSMYSFDSMLYFISNKRGVASSIGFKSFDFSNIVMNNAKLIFSTILSCAACQMIRNLIFKKKKQKETDNSEKIETEKISPRIKIAS